MTGYSVVQTAGFGTLVFVIYCTTCAHSHATLTVPPARNWVASNKNPDKKCLGGLGCAENSWGGIPGCATTRKAGCVESNDYSAQSGGPGVVKGRSISAQHPNGQWPSPPQSHGLCGDPMQDRAAKTEFFEPWREQQYLIPTPPQATYKAGEIVTFKVCVHAHHMGMSEFRICETGLDGKTLESVQAGQDCLDKWVLKRAPPEASCKVNDLRADCQPIDELHPERWHWPNGRYDSETEGFAEHTTIVAGRDWNDYMANANTSDPVLQMAGSCYTMRYIIPKELSCKKCTMQWWWVSGNQCMYDKDVPVYMKQMAKQGWEPFTRAEAICHADGAYGEEFWNCADIAVEGPTTTTTTRPTMARRRRRSTRRRTTQRRRSSRRRTPSRRRRRSTRRRSTRRRKA